MGTSSGVVQQSLSKDDNKSVTMDSEKTITFAGHSDTAVGAGKDDSSDIVSQTKSGSAPVSVISSAQSMDPSKKDSGKVL